ncbi:hypothetical protein [Tardiphaga sp. OK245]|uniref:hypothetical protein n=1 Tax=Tardiphaga sp. OK245 TaxID=1855306 RepID=UPI0008A80432|nr:hypothetical protein [Tardiphaga sp. OK245]SEI20927.1 Transposase [Tardiphaga sp. OK245]
MTLALPFKKFIATVGPPHLDESLRGYLGRALSVTAIRNVTKMLKIADATKPNAVALATTLTDAGEIERIATLIGCTPRDIVSRTYRTGEFAHSGSESIDFFGTQIRLHFRETKFRRVSPRALEIDPYHRAIWELRPIAFDRQTKEKLLSACPACDRKLGWLRADVPNLCDKCDADLRDFQQPVSPVEDEEAYDFVVDLIDPDPAKKEAARALLPEEWRDFSNGDLFEAIVALASGLTADPTKKGAAQGRSKRSEQFEQLTPALLALAGRAIIGGVAGFADLCDRYRADMDKRPIYYGRRKEIGPLAYITYDKHIEPSIRDLLRALVDGNMESTSERYALRLGKDAASSTMTIQTLSETFGVRRSILQRLAESGLVPVIRADDARSPVRMSIRDVRPLLAQIKNAVGENEAAGILGLPLSVLSSLADHGLIRRLEGRVQGLVPGYSGYLHSSVNQLMAEIWSAARPSFGRCCSIMVAARSLGAGETPWAAVISAIIAGDVVIHDTGAQRRNIRFSLAVSDIDSFVAGVNKHLQNAPLGLKLPRWIAQSTAAELLQVNVAFFSRLANIRPDLLPQRGPGYAPYLANDVQALHAKYIFVPEIARRADMHPRRVVSWLRSEHVAPSLSLQENRDFGYPRSVVDPLLIELIDKTKRMKASLAEAGDGVRVKLIAAVAAGAGPKATAEAMDIPYREAKRWIEAWRKAGAVAPRKFGHRSKLDDQKDFLRTLVAQRPDIKLSEIRQALEPRGVKTSDTAIWNALERFDIKLGGRRRPTGRG